MSQQQQHPATNLHTGGTVVSLQPQQTPPSGYWLPCTRRDQPGSNVTMSASAACCKELTLDGNGSTQDRKDPASTTKSLLLWASGARAALLAFSSSKTIDKLEHLSSSWITSSTTSQVTPGSCSRFCASRHRGSSCSGWHIFIMAATANQSCSNSSTRPAVALRWWAPSSILQLNRAADTSSLHGGQRNRCQ